MQARKQDRKVESELDSKVSSHIIKLERALKTFIIFSVYKYFGREINLVFNDCQKSNVVKSITLCLHL